MIQQNIHENARQLVLEETNCFLDELKQKMELVLETYSNVHRGAGHFSLITTALYEDAREKILDYLGLNKTEYLLIFCSSYGAEMLQKQLYYKNYKKISSNEIGLPLGVTVMAIKRKVINNGIPFYKGGSTVKIVSPNSLIWADQPQRFEAGTPNIVNAISFAIALTILKKNKIDAFQQSVNHVYSIHQLFYADEFLGLKGHQMMLALQKSLFGKDIQVATLDEERSFINFDNAASTPTFYPVWNVVKKVLELPKFLHTEIANETKNIIFDFLNVTHENYDLFYTTSTTESINIAAHLFQAEFKDEDFVVLTTILEHNSNELPWRYLPHATVVRIDCDSNGFVDLMELEGVLFKYNSAEAYGKKRVRLLAISGASNVLGTYNDIDKICQIAHNYNVRVLIDGAQLVAHRKIDIDKLNVDCFAFSGHKIYAPFGSGVLIYKKDIFQKSISELKKINLAGSENIIGIAAIGKALNLLQRIGMNIVEKHELSLTRQLLDFLSAKQEIEVFGISCSDAPEMLNKGGIISFSLKNVPHNLVAKELAELGGIGVRNGCFCAHLLVKKLLKIHPARAFAADLGLLLMPRYISIILPGLVRVSFGIQNLDSEVVNFARTLEKIIQAPRSTMVKKAASTHNGTNKLPKNIVNLSIREFVKSRNHELYE